MKKAISILLAAVIAISVIVPGLTGLDFATTLKAEATTSRASDAYATVFTASDFQDNQHGNLVVSNLKAMINNAINDGITDEPDAFLFGGDFTSTSYGYADSTLTVPRMTEAVNDIYPYYNTKNIVNVQGNHDVYDASVFNATGLYEFDNFLVYVINLKDYPASRGDGALEITEATAEALTATFDQLLTEGETRPIFITTHLPLHYNSRNPNATNADGTTGYNENHYGLKLFDVINAYATVFDVIFLFGHNHSGDYDDYVGGGAVYLGRGQTMKLHNNTTGEGNYVERTLNFTYMNYGFAGYVNNTVNPDSTMGAFEICPDRIEVTKYSTTGVSKTYEIERLNKLNEPTVNVAGYGGGTLGSATGAIAIASGFTDPVYTWSSSNNSIAKISANGRVAQISYNQAGTATVTVTVTERNNSSKTASDSYSVIVENKTNPQATTIRTATQIVNDKTLEYYETPYGTKIALIGSYEGLSANATTSWSSSDTSVAEVDQYGNVTFVGGGSTFITYTVTDTSKSYTASAKVKLVISSEKKTEYIYEEVDKSTFSAGKKYVIATTRTTVIYKDQLGSTTQGQRILGTAWTLDGTSPNRTVAINDDAYVWSTIATGTDGVYYLQNESSGLYLAARDSVYMSGRGDFYFSDTVPSVAEGGWKFDANGNLQNETYHWYVRGTETNLLGSAATGYTVLFEKKSASSSATIEFRGEEANGTTQTVYSASNGMSVALHGDYTNVQELESATWTSSNTNVATVDQNGVLTFKGVQGETTVTYTVKDAVSGESVSATVTISALLAAQQKRIFKYVTKIEAGKKYVVATKAGEIGDAFLLSSFRDTKSSLLAEPTVVKVSSNSEYYVEIEIDENYPVWIAEADGSFFNLKSEKEGRYLYANETSNNEGTVNTSASVGADADAVTYQWSYSNPGIYNQYVLDGENTYLRSRSANFVGMGTKAQSEYYFYEESSFDPNGVITSRYENVGSTLIRNEICPDQTETFVPKAEYFPDNSKVTFAWSSDNDEVATIDQNGVITYTGKPGVVNITLTTTSLEYDENGTKPVDTTTVAVTVVGDDVTVITNNFYLTDSFVAGEKYILLAVKTNESGSAISMAVSGTKEGAKLVGEEITPADDVITTDDTNIVWICEESSSSGWFYFKNEYTGEYLFINKTGDTVSTSSTKDDNALLQYYYKTNDSGVSTYVIRNKSAGALIRYSSGFYESSSGAAFELYEQRDSSVSEGDIAVETEIRTQDYFGSVDITNVMQYRYEIANGDTEQFLQYIRGLEDGYTATWSVSDTSIATIDQNGLVTYKGKDGLVDVKLTVNGTDYDGNAVSKVLTTTVKVSTEEYKLSDNDYPNYPDEGSVRIGKTASNAAGGTNFQNSGVTEVELAVTGVPVETPVDVVIVFDHSDSMGPVKMQSAIEDTRDFALQLFNANPNNRVALVTFDQYRYYYDTITDTSMSYSGNGTEDKIVTGDGTIQNAFATIDDRDAFVEAIESMENNNDGGTNYDSGLNYAYRILQQAKTDPEANDNQVVVFMSDGAPTKFNGLKVGDSDVAGMSDAWLLGDETNETLATYLADTTTYPAAALFNTNGDNWFGAAIKTAEGQEVEGMPYVDFYSGYHTGLGAKMFTIGYAVNAGSKAEAILTSMASTPANYYNAANNLQAAYDSILEQILYAANDAVVTDKMGEDFDVQFATSFDMSGTTVTLNPVPSIEVGYWTLDNIGNRTSYNVMETITFTTNANGILTGATSSVLGDCYDTNSSTINGQYVSYNLLTETFTWNVGDINRNEITLKYYACLEGAADGAREAGTFDTNESAILTYTNYRGVACEKTFPVPTLGWKQAAVSYDFYLVNAEGQPINRDGVVVPFAERVLVGREQTKKLYLNNTANISAYELIATNEIPDGYILFNEDAVYSVSVSSIDGASSASISDSTLTTYFRDGSTAINVNGPIESADYYNTAVSFAVKYTESIIPDSVVIDYGLPVKISVLGNDYGVTGGSITKVGKTLASGTALHSGAYTTSKLTGGTTDVALTYGKASIDGEYVIYTPTTTNMPAEEVFYYEYKTADNKYYYTTITVIPAANIYYEESFMTFNDGDGYAWTDAGTTITGKFQAEDRPGTFSFSDFDADNVYGNDSAYADNYTYSLGSAKMTTVDSKSFGKEPTATFTFCGTGFDFFSVTSSDTGAVFVVVDGKNYIVNTYYGYAVDDSGSLIPSSQSNGLYQVPVVSLRNLSYGTHNVTIKPMYSFAFDPNYANGYGDYSIYVDSVRIFNPAGTYEEGDTQVSDDIADVYLKDAEYSPVFADLRDTLLSAENYYDDAIADFKDENGNPLYNGSLYIDGNSSNSFNATGVETYKKQGPNNEVYLSKNQAVAFMLRTDSIDDLASLQLGMKIISRADDETEGQIVVMNSNDKQYNTVAVDTAHETFKKISSAIIWKAYVDENDETYYETAYPIILVNTSDTVISFTAFKWARTTLPESGEQAALNFIVGRGTDQLAYMALKNVMAAQEENVESKPYDEEEISIEWSDETFTEGKEATLKVTTPPEVVKVTVGGIEIDECEIDDNGNKIWTYTFVVQQAGENAYEVIFYDYNGGVSEPVMTETIYVEEAEDEPTTDEPTTDEPTTDEPTTDEPTTDTPDTDDTTEPSADDSAFDKVLQVLSDVFNKVLSFLKSIIEFFWRLFV